jgi:hypothetical protein
VEALAGVTFEEQGHGVLIRGNIREPPDTFAVIKTHKTTTGVFETRVKVHDEVARGDVHAHRTERVPAMPANIVNPGREVNRAREPLVSAVLLRILCRLDDQNHAFAKARHNLRIRMLDGLLTTDEGRLARSRDQEAPPGGRWSTIGQGPHHATDHERVYVSLVHQVHVLGSLSTGRATALEYPVCLMPEDFEPRNLAEQMVQHFTDAHEPFPHV